MNFDRVLVLSPHTDDGELGAGGTIAKLVENGSNITYVVFWSNEVLRTECEKCLKVLGIHDLKLLDFTKRRFPTQRQEILQFLYDYSQTEKFDLVLTPSTLDLHQDHQVISQETSRAFKHSTILGYELPWNHIVFHENCFVPLEKSHVEKKLKALSNYETQKNRIYFDKRYLWGLAMSRGVQVGEKYAEAFEVIKLVLNKL